MRRVGLISLKFIFLLTTGLVYGRANSGDEFRIEFLQDYRSGIASFSNNEFSTRYEYKVVKSNPKNFQVNFSAALYDLKAEMDEDFCVKHSVIEYKDDRMIQALGHDKRVSQRNETGKKLTIHYLLNKREIKKEEMDYNSATMDTDLGNFFLQGKLMSHPGDFNADIIVKSRGLKVNADFRLVSSADLIALSPEYHLPVLLKRKMARNNEEFYVYVMSLSGWVRYFYPHKFYYVFSKKNPYNFIGYWGGAPNKLEYMFSDT